MERVFPFLPISERVCAVCVCACVGGVRRTAGKKELHLLCGQLGLLLEQVLCVCCRPFLVRVDLVPDGSADCCARSQQLRSCRTEKKERQKREEEFKARWMLGSLRCDDRQHQEHVPTRLALGAIQPRHVVVHQ